MTLGSKLDPSILFREIPLRFLTYFLLALCFSVIFLKSWLYFDHNDFFYASAAARTGSLYRDLHFVQAPLTYWFWHSVYLISPEGHGYFAMRITSALLTCVAIIPIVAFVLKDEAQKILFLLLCASTFYVVRAGQEIANYSLALALTSFALTFFLSKNRRTIIFSGLLFGLAASARINHVLLYVPALFLILMGSESFRSRCTMAASFSILFGIGSGFAAFYFLSSPHAFVLHNVLFHSELMNSYRGLDFLSSAKRIIKGSSRFINRHVVEVAILGVVLYFSNRQYKPMRKLAAREIFDRAFRIPGPVRNVVTVSAFFATSLIMAISPMIIFNQYFILSGLLLIILLIMSFDLIEREQRQFGFGALSVISILRVLILVPTLVWAAISRPVPLVEHSAISRNIEQFSGANEVEPSRCNNSAFSLSGSFLIDTNLPLSAYTEGGVFWNLVHGHVRERYLSDARYEFDPALTNPIEYIYNEKVAYVLTGYYPDTDFEQQFVAQSRANHFIAHPVGIFQGKQMLLFARDDCTE